MRIADILQDTDDEYYSGDSTIPDFAHRPKHRRTFQCMPPWLILSRWLSSPNKTHKSLGKIENLERERRRKEADDEIEELYIGRERKEQTKCSINGLNGDSSSSSPSELNGDSGIAETSGQDNKEACFNLGAGFGMVYLVAARTTQLSNIMELQTQMETLLQDVKEELENIRTHILSKTSSSIGDGACSTVDAQESLRTSEDLSLQNITQLENTSGPEIPTVSNQSLNCDTSRQERRMEDMDQLQAELEVELERLLLHSDTEDMSETSKQQRIGMPFEEVGPEESFTSCAEVVDPPPKDATEEHWLVPPNELERRLHELLEARQQERIEELETALECAMLNLYEKERELSLWKDIARLISQHVPDSYCLLRK